MADGGKGEGVRFFLGDGASIRTLTCKLGVDNLCASAAALAPTRSDSEVERCSPSLCLSFSLVRFLADFDMPVHTPDMKISAKHKRS